MLKKYAEFNKGAVLEEYEEAGNPLAAYEPLEAMEPTLFSSKPTSVSASKVSSNFGTPPPPALVAAPGMLDVSKLIDDSDSESLEVAFDDAAKQETAAVSNKKRKILAGICIVTLIMAAVGVFLLVSTSDDWESDDVENIVVDYESSDVVATVPAGLTKRLAISGKKAYLADEAAGVSAYDIIVPSAPVKVALLEPDENFKIARSLCVYNDVLTVADAVTGNILFYDVSGQVFTFLSQFRVTSRNTSDTESEFLVYRPIIGDEKDVVFVLDESSGMHLLSVEDPVNPTYLSHVLHDDHPTAIYVKGGLAYVILRDKLAIVRVDDHLNPLVVSKLDLYTTVDSVYVNNQRAYLNDDSGGVYIVDVSDDQKPFLLEVDERGEEVVAAAALGTQRSATTLESEFKYNTQIAVYGRITISASRGEVWVISYEETETDVPKKLKRIPELDGTHGFIVEDDFIYAVTQNGEFVVVKMSVVRKSVKAFVPKEMEAANSNISVHWMRDPLLLALDKVGEIDVNMTELNLNSLDFADMPEPAHMVHGVRTLLDFKSAVENYYKLYDTEDLHLTTLDGLSNVMSHNVPAPHSETSVRVNTILCNNEIIDETVLLNIRLSALSVVPAYSFQTGFRNMLAPIETLHELWELLDQNAPPSGSVTTPDLDTYYEATATVEILIGINTETEAISITVKDYHAEVQVLVDPVDIVIGNDLLTVADGTMSMLFGIKSKPLTTATVANVNDDTDLMSSIYASMDPKPFGKLDVVLPLLTDSERFIPIIAIHDLDILDGTASDMTVDLDLSFLKVQEKDTSINHLNFATSTLNQLIDDVTSYTHNPDSVYSENIEYFMSGINGTVDFDEILDQYLQMHESYRQLGNGLPHDLKLDEYRSRQQIVTSVLFQREILAKLQNIKPAVFGRFSDTGGADPITGEVFKPIDFIDDIMKLVFGISGDEDASGKQFGIEHLSWILSLKKEYQLSRKNALALINILPLSMQQDFDTDFEIPRNKSNGVVFSPEEFLPELFSALGMVTTDANRTLLVLGEFLATVPPTYGVNNDFQSDILSILNISYPALFGGFQSNLSNPATGSIFDWRDYLPEVGHVLRVDLKYERELDLIFGSSPTVGGFLNFLKNHFEYRYGNGANFAGSILTLKGDRYLTMDLGLVFNIDLLGNNERVTEPVFSRALEGTGLGPLMKQKLIDLMKEMTPGINGESGARLTIDVKVGMAISPLLKSRNAGRPQMYVMVPTMKLEGSLKTEGYTTTITFASDETTDLTFPVRDANISLSFGVETSNPKTDPIMIIDERSSMPFNTEPLLKSLKEIGTTDMQVPVRFPSLKESVLLSLNFEHVNNNSVGVAKAAVSSLPVVVSISDTTTITFLADGSQFDFPIPEASFSEIGMISLVTYLKEAFGDFCPYKMLGQDQLTDTVPAFFADPGNDISYTITEWNIDLCASAVALAAKTQNMDVDVRTLPMSESTLTMSSNKTTWSGLVSATTTMFDTQCEATIGINTSWEVASASVSCDILTPTHELRTVVNIGSQSCDSSNVGVAEYFSTDTGFRGSGTVTQKDICSTNGDPLWVMMLQSSDSATIWDVKVTKPNITLSSSSEADPNTGGFITQWSGELQGGVAIGDTSDITATVVFEDLNMNVTSVSLQGTAVIGPVSGQLALSYQKTDMMLTGTATNLSVTLSNAVLSGITSTVSHVVTYVPQNAHLPLWSVVGDAPSLSVFGVEIKPAFVNLTGSISQNTTSWTGQLTGKGSFMAGADLSVTADISPDEKLTALIVTNTISSGGLEFIGTTEISEDNEESPCKTFESMGDLTFSKLNTTFAGEFQYFNCRTSPADTLYELKAVGFLSDPYAGVTFSDAISSELTSTVGSPTSFSGQLTSTAMLFGNSALAVIPVTQNTLQELRISTFFTTLNGLISGDLEFEHINDCNTPSPGTGGATVRMAGLNPIKFRGPVEHNSCSGVVKMYGTFMNPWVAGDGKSYQWLEVNLTSASNGGNPSASLSTRKWTGVITAHPATGLSQQYFIDSTNMNASAVIMWDDPQGYISVAVALDDCGGQGTVTVRNLPGNIPPFEVGVNFSRPVCIEKAWTLRGWGRNIVIPFGSGKRLTIEQILVEVTNDNGERKSVRIVGDLIDFQSEMFFQLQPFRNFSLTGRPKLGQQVTLDSVAKEFVSPIGSSTGAGHPDLHKAMKDIVFDNVLLVVNFTEMYAYVSADASFFGMPVQIMIAAGAGTSGSSWGFGFLVTALDLTARSGTPKIIETIITELKPQMISFGICKDSFQVLDISSGRKVNFRRGISITAILGFTSAVVDDVMKVAPQDMAQQISSAKDPDSNGLIVVADILSISEVDVFIMLAGNIPLGNDVVLREVALCFRISTVSAVGFLVKLDFTLGDTNPQLFQAGGYIAMDTTGALTIGLSMDSNKPWDKPFGISGTKVLFPVGVEMSVIPAVPPVLTRFVLIGGLQVGAASGSVAIGADLVDFRKSAFKGQVDNLNFRNLLLEVCDCTKCVEGPGEVLTDSSIEHISASFNPDPARHVIIRAGAISEIIPAGIHVNATNLKVMGALNVASASFMLDTHGLKADMQLDPVTWGPLDITAAGDITKGPSFSLTLNIFDRILAVQGQVQVLGFSAALDLYLSNKVILGSLYFNINQFPINATLEVTGKPTASNFKNVITGTFGTDATKKLETDSRLASSSDLSASYGRELSKAQSDKDSKQKTYDDKKADYAKEKAASDKKVAEAKKELERKEKEKNDAKCPKCRSFTSCAKSATCNIVKTAEKAWEGAKDTLSKLESEAKKLVDSATRLIDDAKRALDKAVEALNAATKALEDLANLIKQFAENLVKIQKIEFSSTLTRASLEASIKADVTIAGERHVISYRGKIYLEDVKKAIQDKATDVMDKIVK
eukprot:TRINITY_DN16684_c0_g1_i1.p1 TRINITY_DN16684_c0_g1~~TRINITY_DN16684_c0_g1_i1.p1  ORF type:complete len:2917 (+),score=582.56 TRINITY_DN16684_c0_g1_i1:71-8752(+)